MTMPTTSLFGYAALILVHCFVCSNVADGAPANWQWERYEVTAQGTIAMHGEAHLVKQTAGQYVFSLANDERQIDAFDVRVTDLGAGKVAAYFSPPNTEKIVIRLVGRHHSLYPDGGRYFVLANSDAGNFLVIRERPESTRKPSRAKK